MCVLGMSNETAINDLLRGYLCRNNSLVLKKE
jgi:hypothetical protein